MEQPRSKAEPEGRGITPPVNVNLEGLFLLALDFQSKGKPQGGLLNVPVNLKLALLRPEENVLVADLSLTIDMPTVVSATITYRCVFRAAAAPVEEPNLYWRMVAARIAPAVAYPYIRETFGYLSLKAGHPQPLLPVMNVGAFFDPQTIDLPDVQGKATEAGADPP
jgi:preprotein translocase subunit SecB